MKIKIGKPQELIEKESREARIKQNIEQPKSNPTNRDIQQLLLDTNSRLSEIYDLLKSQ